MIPAPGVKSFHNNTTPESKQTHPRYLSITVASQQRSAICIQKHVQHTEKHVQHTEKARATRRKARATRRKTTWNTQGQENGLASRKTSFLIGRKSEGLVGCCYGQCRSDERCPQKYKGIAFFLFPKPNRWVEDCKAWIRASGRPHH